MTLKDLGMLAVPVALDWVWDKIGKWRESRARDEGIEVIQKSLRELGAAGDRVVTTIDKGMEDLAISTNRWSRKRWTNPPPPNGDHDR